ncbi:MAG: hypothetical protein ACR2QJ_11065 [Geminicoccaceae bacterium]
MTKFQIINFSLWEAPPRPSRRAAFGIRALPVDLAVNMKTAGNPAGRVTVIAKRGSLIDRRDAKGAPTACR